MHVCRHTWQGLGSYLFSLYFLLPIPLCVCLFLCLLSCSCSQPFLWFYCRRWCRNLSLTAYLSKFLLCTQHKCFVMTTSSQKVYPSCMLSPENDMSCLALWSSTCMLLAIALFHWLVFTRLSYQDTLNKARLYNNANWHGSLSLLFKGSVSCPRWDLNPHHWCSVH